MEAYASHSLQDEGSSDSEFDDASKDDDASKEESDAESDTKTFAKPPSLNGPLATLAPTAKQPPTPVQKSANDLSHHQITTQLVALRLKPSGFYHDDMETLQESYDMEFAKAVQARNDWVNAQTIARREQIKERQQIRIAWREQIEEEDALKRNPGIAAFIKNVKSGDCDKHVVFNNVGPVICRYIVKNIPPDSGITSLELCRNRINDKIATNIAEMLKSNKTLKKLELESNRICASGCAEIANAVAGNNTLEYLSMMANPLSSNSDTRARDNSGLDAISKMLQHNSSLRTLNIRSTQIDSLGGTSLVQGLLTNDNLLILEMDTTDLKFQGLSDLGAKITENKQRWVLARRQARERRLAETKASAAQAKKQAKLDKIASENTWERDQRRARIRARQKILEAQVQDHMLEEQRRIRYEERVRQEEMAKRALEERRKERAEKERKRHRQLPHRTR